MTAPDGARARLIADALRRRLEEVRRTAPPAAAARPAPAPDPEERLRVTMVRLLPAVRSEAAGPDDADRLADALDGLAEPARGDDLRFLDAWNNAYEALDAPAAPVASPKVARMLTEYAELLEWHVRQLSR